MEFSRQEYESGFHSLLQGIFPIQGSNPGSCIEGRFFPIWATREAPSFLFYWSLINKNINKNKSLLLCFSLSSKFFSVCILKIVSNLCGCPSDLDGKKFACSVGDQVWSLGWEDTLEKEMATHSTIHA